MNHKEEPQEKKQDESEDKLAKLTAECEQLRDKYIRMCADFDNARKRWDRDKEDLLKFANYSLLKELVGIVDEIDQALKSTAQHKSYDEIVKGLGMTIKNFGALLKRTVSSDRGSRKSLIRISMRSWRPER